jgi:hypothetical protein
LARPGVRGTFSQAGPSHPAASGRLARTLGRILQHLAAPPEYPRRDSLHKSCARPPTVPSQRLRAHPKKAIVEVKRRHFPIAMALTGLLPACSDGIDVAEWTEEVKLHDGRMIDVWRRARRGSSGFPNANRGALLDTELRDPITGAAWKSGIYRNPCSFEIFDGVPHMTLWIRDRESCRAKPRTDYQTQFLRWTGAAWLDVPQRDFPVGRALMNLSLEFWGGSTADDYKGRIGWDEKRLTGNRSPMDTVQTYFERGSRYCAGFHDS